MTDLNDTAHPVPQLLPAIGKLLVAGFVGLSLAAVVTVSTSASQAAVRTVVAQLQDAPRVVTLPRVQVVARRDMAMGAPAAPIARATSAAAPAPGCIQAS
ncbi:MAG: hypothetical protein ACXWC6_11490 [Ramlibacter sp.]